MAKMKPVHLPQAAGDHEPDEVKRLIAAAGNLKHQTALALAYATGLRVNEVVHLKVSDIDSQRMTLRVEQGKGQKDRYALLAGAPRAPARLVARRPCPRQDAGRWLAISGPGPGGPPQHSPTQPRHPCSRRRGRHRQTHFDALLRHAFATHLLEQKVDIRLIQVLLGHKKLETTALYAQVATDILREVVSPLERLNTA
jgi:site-specific recombinase XerD